MNTKNNYNDDELMKTLSNEHIETLSIEYKNASDEQHDTSDLDEWFSVFISEYTKSDEVEEVRRVVKRKKISRIFMSRIAAIMALSITIGLLFVFSREITRSKSFIQFSEPQEGYTDIVFEEDTDLLEHINKNWIGSYIPMYIPEGYTLFDVNEQITFRTLSYKYQNRVLTLQQFTGETTLSIDTEDANSESLLINSQPAVLTVENKHTSLVWIDSGGTKFILSSEGLTSETLQKIAINLKKIN